MPNLDQLMSDVRILVDEGRSQSPSPRQLLYALVRTVNGYYNRLSMSDKCWAVDEMIVEVSPSEASTLINAPSGFAKPLQLWTYYPENPSYVPRYINFFEADSFNLQWGFPNNYGYNLTSLDGSPNTAVRAAFVWQGTQVYLKLLPIQQLSAAYLLLYSIGDWMSTAGLQSTPVITNHHHLIALKTALAVLPLCKWYDDDKANMERRKELAGFLTPEFEIAQKDFDIYIRSLHQNQVVMMSSSSIDRSYW